MGSTNEKKALFFIGIIFFVYEMRSPFPLKNFYGVARHGILAIWEYVKVHRVILY